MMKISYHAMSLMGWAMLLMAGWVSAAEGDEWAPKGSASPQASYTWGPYTSEGMFLSERNNERFGWATEKVSLQPYVQSMAVYEDNLFLNSTDKESELYTVVTPGAMAVYGNPRSSYLYLDYSADFTDLQVDNSGTLDGQTLKAGAYKLDAKSQLNASHEYREVRDVDVQVGSRLKRKSNTTSAGYDNRVSSKTSVGVLGRHTMNEFDDGAYTDYRDYSASGRVAWQMRPKTSLTGRAGHGWVDVDERRDAYGSAQYDEVAVGISGRPATRLETSGEVGVQHRYFENSNIDDITSEVGSVRVAGDPWERLRVWLSASAGMRPAINAAGYTVYDTRIEPGISRRLFSERVVGAVSGFWGQSEYSGTAEGSIDPRVYDGRQDQYWGVNASIDWWAGRYWSFGLGYSYINNDSSADEDLSQGRGVDAASYEAGRWTLRAAFNR